MDNLQQDNLVNNTEIHIDESNIKSSEDMSTTLILDNKRICLIGTVVDDKITVEAAQTFNVPIITSETGLELIEDQNWTTYFIMNDFESTIFDAIHKTKHKIMGPPALQQAVQLKEGLPSSNRPIYNYAMRGVITCFTGIRKKDELTRLVHLIHSMGGSIRKDMNSKVTHLICNTSGGEKYLYAMTFRLAVVRPAWVYDSWEHRNDLKYSATKEEITIANKLRAFEGLHICFLGFPIEEHQHMIEVLINNGGIPTELDDPECTHVIISNTGEHFPEHVVPSTSLSSSMNTSTISNARPIDINVNKLLENDCNRLLVKTGNSLVRVLNFCEAENDNNLNVLNDVAEIDEDPESEIQMIDADNENLDSVDHMNENVQKTLLTHLQQSLYPPPTSPITETGTIEYCSTPTGIIKQKNNRDINELQTDNDDNTLKVPVELSHTTINKSPTDGIVLTSHEANEFINPNNISPILNIKPYDDSFGGGLHKIEEEEDEETQSNKRKRDSLDDVSLISTDSIMPNFQSAKKPKLIRTGSLTKTIRRSMSFTVIKTPITNMLRSRRNSVDPNASISSITSIETTFNESIKKPIKEKFRSIRDRITKSGKKDINMTPKSTKLVSSNFDTLKRICKMKVDKVQESINEYTENDELQTPVSFKTPIIPSKILNPRHSICGNLPTITTIATTTPTRKSLAATTTSNTVSDNSKCPVVVDTFPVVDEHVVQTKPELKNNKTHILKADWFWYTIQNGYAEEQDYLFGDYLDSIANTPGGDRRDSLPISFNKRKRKRLSQRIIPDTPLGGAGKRRSSVSDAGLLSVSGSFLDCTTSPDKHEISKHITEAEPTIETTTTLKNKSMRYNHFMDFFHTESNYVGILDTIVTLFKVPLEEKSDLNDSEALLNKSEIKSIFSNFIPIHQVHKKMLESLSELQKNWSEDCLIGQIILENRNDLIKAYPPYVNFFQQMKEALILCDTQKPRFHAFLKINQAKPECGRQSLQDLMIRPVQRLPSVSLLLNDILKHTSKNNPDHKKLDEALKAIKEVMTYINEDKRKTEGQLAMFDIFNDIDCCPPHLVSSHRNFISKCEVTELSDNLSGRGDSLMLFLFSDTLEVCKKRSRGFNSAKSPSTTINGLNSTRGVTTTKPYKHIKLMPLSSVRLVIDIRDSPRAFALNCRTNQDTKEKLYSFSICDEEVDKIIYLKNFCKQLAENACRTDTDKFLINFESHELGIDISDVNIGTLSKAFKFATRTRLKVGRAFSFNKTPSKLKRAVSTMMTSPFGSTHSLTPSSQLAQMKLASCTNINEVGEDENSSDSPTSSEVLIAPMSVQPTRKNNKSSTLSLALKRL